jgi:catechol-2,3-dioxygenase
MLRPFNPRVFQLGYVGLGVADLDASLDYYARVLGLVETARGEGQAYLSIGAEHHNVVLSRATEKAFLFQGYQLPPGEDLGRFLGDVKAFGLPAQRKSDAHPGVADMVEVKAPGGYIFHFYSETTYGRPAYARSGIAPMRLGHVAIVTPEAALLRRFFEEFLGFHYTDDIGGIATFMTCNRDHHVVNIVNLPQQRVHHIAFELHQNADHVKACDLLARSARPTLWGPSRHHAGHNLASYHYDPDRVMIEIYTDMDVYVPAIGAFEPRPWHQEVPLRPQSWRPEQMTSWETHFGFDLVTA